MTYEDIRRESMAHLAATSSVGSGVGSVEPSDPPSFGPPGARGYTDDLTLPNTDEEAS
jgi:hypothetical protein